MHEEKVLELRKLTENRLKDHEAKKLILETGYLRPGNSGDKWPGLYGPFRFWFSMDKHRKVRMSWDPNATDEAIKVWEKIAAELYGNRYVSHTV